MSTALCIRLFGTLEARAGQEALVGLHLRDGERLLAFLTIHHGVPHSYRTLAQLFWPMEAHQNDVYEGGNYPSTRQAIFSLRRVLGDHSWRLSSPSKGMVRFDLTDADVDLLEFERLVQLEDVEAWRRALDLHHAPLLHAWPESWVREPRTRCWRSMERMALRLQAAGPSGAKPRGGANSASGDTVEECARLEAVGGAVPLNSAFYVERETDREFMQALARQDSIVLVKGARQIGKTSLMARGLQQARQSGGRLILTDFQSMGDQPLETVDALYRMLAQDMADQLDLDILPESIWNDRRSAGRNLERYLSDVVLKSQSTTLVWALDEIDRLFGAPCSNEVFGLFRSWHNRRALDPSGPWSRLTLVIAYATEAHLFITDQNQSPFNVGTRLTLSDFTREQVAELNHRHGSPLECDADICRFYDLLGGHPFLVRCGLAEVAGREMTIDKLETRSLQEEGPLGDHLGRLRSMLNRSPELSEMMRDVLKGEPSCAIETVYPLRSAGLVVNDAKGNARPRCRLYAAYLARHLSVPSPT